MGVVTEQVVPAGTLDQPPFLYHCAGPALCVLDGQYNPHQWILLLMGGLKIFKIYDQYFQFF